MPESEMESQPFLHQSANLKQCALKATSIKRKTQCYTLSTREMNVKG